MVFSSPIEEFKHKASPGEEHGLNFFSSRISDGDRKLLSVKIERESIRGTIHRWGLALYSNRVAFYDSFSLYRVTRFSNIKSI